jgi:hypothetical protein
MMMAAGTSYRLQHSHIVVDGTVPLDFSKYPYVPEIIDEHAPTITIIKGAQMGFTIACVMRALEEAKDGNFRGIGYFFPTEGEVSDFAKARFGPMMTNNDEIWGQFVKDTDSAALKRINQTFLYFRGMGQKGSGSAKRSTSKLKSIPLDRLYLDERDEMDDSRVDAAEHRLDGSDQPEKIVLSTPTLPGYGVDYDYQRSDQRVWMWKCSACNEWTCLELTYPECIVEPVNQDPYYRCSNAKCHKRLTRSRGQWVARKPDITDHRGYWVSQLASPTKTASDIVTAAMRAIEDGRRSEFENQTLARAYAEVDQEITASQLEELVVPYETRPLRHEGPCAMGVDPCKPHWYTIRVRLTEKDSFQIARGRADTYEELSKLVKQFNVRSGVMDMGYDPSAVARFCRDHDGWYGCLYIGGKTGDPDWDHKNRQVKAGRTRTLDQAHNVILSKRVKYHQKDEFWHKHFVPQMTNLKRATIENDVTGDRKAEWVVTGGKKNDHLRHADAYCELALSRSGLAKNVTRAALDAKRSGKRRSRGGLASL